MPDIRIGNTLYRLDELDSEMALSHALGRTYIQLQQLEFAIISFLNILSGGSAEPGGSFDVFASKTFGTLIQELRKHTFLRTVADDLQTTKQRRDFFVHKFLFHRYGGPLMTTDEEYEALVFKTCDLTRLFNSSRVKLENFMVDKSPFDMFVAVVDPQTGEVTIRSNPK